MGTVLSSIVVETLEAPLPVGTALYSVVVETLEAPLPVGTVLSSVYVETMEQPLLPIAVVPNISGTVGSPATFDGSGSVRVDDYSWTLTGVPAGSSVSIPVPSIGSTLTFTPDVAGTYSVQLEVSADVYGLVVTDTATADAVITAPSTGGIGFPGEDLRPLIGLFATRRKKDT